MVAEFGDFRHFPDPVTPPSPEIREKITKMRHAELRHDLIIAKNRLRYNNYILEHHNAP
jgi:hypothetical protein